MDQHGVECTELKNQFFNRYAHSSTVPDVFFAPGRINILGEHLDYNGGYVLPCALGIGTYLAIRRRRDQRVIIASAGYHEIFESELEHLPRKSSNDWWNYPLGVMHELHLKESDSQGFEMQFVSNLPTGVGLSSSASIEVVTAFALNEILKKELSLQELALLCRRAENDFVGVQCGIMDQYAVAFGKKEHAIFLDTKHLVHELVPVQLGNYMFLISDTNTRRQLETTAFNERYHECRDALKTMQRLLNVQEIADTSPEEFEEIEHWFPDESARKRARHIVFENERVKQGAAALRNGEVEKLAGLMNASYESSRDNYEISCFELDALIGAARASPGCLGARISGAGFGGCTLNLVNKIKADEFMQETRSRYRKVTGLTAQFYPVEIGSGVSMIN
jgi:galactokinase